MNTESKIAINFDRSHFSPSYAYNILSFSVKDFITFFPENDFSCVARKKWKTEQRQSLWRTNC